MAKYTNDSRPISRNRDNGNYAIKNAIFSNKISGTATITRDEKYRVQLIMRPGFENRPIEIACCVEQTLRVVLINGVVFLRFLTYSISLPKQIPPEQLL